MLTRIKRTSLLLLLAFSCLVGFQSSLAAEQVEPPLSNLEMDVVDWIAQQESEMVRFLETITNINSGSFNKEGIARLARIFNAELSKLGFATSTLSGGLIEMPHCPNSALDFDVADHLLATRVGSGARLLLMGHMDTVFPADSPFQEFSLEAGIIRGPGVFDMKGGLVVMLFALKALDEFDLLQGKTVTVILNSDEEVGSLSSRKYLEQQARQHDYGLVFEGSVNNSQIRQRKGLGQARLVVNGRASHAGAAHQDGRSAIRELAYKIIEIEEMTNYETGVTINVGLVSGGEARNMVAPCAEAYVDLRYPLPQQGDAARQQIMDISTKLYSVTPDSTEISSELWINLHRPPKLPTPASDRLLERTIAIGTLLGEEIGISDSGGGTDGSLTQAVGLPTLDSLGLIGLGGHSQREQADLSSLTQITKRAAILINRLTEAN